MTRSLPPATDNWASAGFANSGPHISAASSGHVAAADFGTQDVALLVLVDGRASDVASDARATYDVSPLRCGGR